MPSLDPTKTATIRRRYTQAMNRRFMRLAQDVRESFKSNHALHVNEAAKEGEFDAATKTEAVLAFETWLALAAQDRILEARVRTLDARQSLGHWQAPFIRGAIIRGMTDAETELRLAGLLSAPMGDADFALTTGEQGELLDLMQKRAFDGLKGIVQGMEAQMSSSFSQSLIEGVTAVAIANRLTEIIAKASKNRAQAMARTEVVRAYNEAKLGVFDRNGVDEVSADVEIKTAGDSDVCERCNALVGKRFTVDASKGIIPLHVLCRCSWQPAKAKENENAA
jgi:SPP1 gp7 family putative phage head morphogenesis protein